MVNTKEVDRLLNNVKKLFDHKKKIEKLKGETFNVFSILKMERMENNTHSAFIKELLDPKGTHLKDGIFLKLFLECIENSDLDVTTAKVELEKHIGTRDDKNKTGGRIDIFISDAKGNYVSIENKIEVLLDLMNYLDTEKTIIEDEISLELQNDPIYGIKDKMDVRYRNKYKLALYKDCEPYLICDENNAIELNKDQINIIRLLNSKIRLQAKKMGSLS